MFQKLHEIRVFENYQLDTFSDGHVIVTTEVVSSSLNYYGNAHGGYLFTLCDQISGLVSRSTGCDAVTMQSNINYLKAGHLGDCLTITGKCLHRGRRTQLVEVLITNEAQELVTRASFTMAVITKKD